jgi:hypothetical protein
MFTVSVKVKIKFTLSDMHTKTIEYNSGPNVLITKNNMGVNGHDTLFHIRLRHSKRTPLLSFSHIIFSN